MKQEYQAPIFVTYVLNYTAIKCKQVIFDDLTACQMPKIFPPMWNDHIITGEIGPIGCKYVCVC